MNKTEASKSAAQVAAMTWGELSLLPKDSVTALKLTKIAKAKPSWTLYQTPTPASWRVAGTDIEIEGLSTSVDTNFGKPQYRVKVGVVHVRRCNSFDEAKRAAAVLAAATGGAQ